MKPDISYLLRIVEILDTDDVGAIATTEGAFGRPRAFGYDGVGYGLSSRASGDGWLVSISNT